MFRYIVVHLKIESEQIPVEDGGDELEEMSYPSLQSMILCKDPADVQTAIEKANEKGRSLDWNVFEIVDSPKGQTAERRAVIFAKDAKTVLEIR
jgi:hypothetical protein